MSIAEKRAGRFRQFAADGNVDVVDLKIAGANGRQKIAVEAAAQRCQKQFAAHRAAVLAAFGLWLRDGRCRCGAPGPLRRWWPRQPGSDLQ